MTNTFHYLAEFDLGPEASALFTRERMEEMIEEVVLAGVCCALLKKEIGAGSASTPVWEPIDLRASVPSAAMKAIKKRAQKGDRMAVLVDDVDNILRIVAARGYVRCAEPSPGSADDTRRWSAWLEQHFPNMPGALIFGHDCDPIFIFTNGRVPPDRISRAN